MATLDAESVSALNALLEDERASVEIEVALSSDATEYVEREALAMMGAEDTEACCDLRERLEKLGFSVSRRINGIVFTVLGLERYDERLRAFAEHQRGVSQGVSALLEHAEGLDREVRRTLEDIRETHARHSAWCLERAQEFALSRQIERLGGPSVVFGPAPHPSNPLIAPPAPEPGIEGLEPEPYDPPAPPADAAAAPDELGAIGSDVPTAPGQSSEPPPDTTLE